MLICLDVAIFCREIYFVIYKLGHLTQTIILKIFLGAIKLPYAVFTFMRNIKISELNIAQSIKDLN